MKAKERADLLGILKARFENNMRRHRGLDWETIHDRLESNPKSLAILQRMEQTGGEPDVIGYDVEANEYIFCDCSAESPKGRRSTCYDREALDSRKEHKPEHNAVDMAAALGIDILTEAQYRELQELGEFDTKTSCWVSTPAAIRELGGALFCDRRYNTVFLYHNGAQSYYASRGFRGLVRL